MNMFRNGNWGLKILALVLAIVLYHTLKHGSVHTDNTNDRSLIQHR